jgi:hypothetical protein
MPALRKNPSAGGDFGIGGMDAAGRLSREFCGSEASADFKPRFAAAKLRGNLRQ